MSFSKAKLKRFNDIGVVCGSPAPTKLATTISNDPAGATPAPTGTTTTSSSSSTAHTERKEQIEKFFKEAVRFASSSRGEAKDFTIPKDGVVKEDKKTKGLRLFRTPSLPQRLRFRHTTSAASNNNHTTNSTPLHLSTTTLVKESSKSSTRLKGKEALQQELRKKNELMENYISQVDVLQQHVNQLKENELKVREEHVNAVKKLESLVGELTTGNKVCKKSNEQLIIENFKLKDQVAGLEAELTSLKAQHVEEIETLNAASALLKANITQLEQQLFVQQENHFKIQQQLSTLADDILTARKKLSANEQQTERDYELIQNLRNTNDQLIADVTQLKRQIEQDALTYAQETKIIQKEMDCLKHERNTLKNDLANKCEFIRSLQEELLEKNCEIDDHCDTIRQLCREKSKFLEKEKLMQEAEERVRKAELQAEQKLQKFEFDLENAIEREKAYWHCEFEKRQKMAENELIKIELEKQDVMVLLENTNDMLRERDEKIQKYEDQLRNGIDYYIQLTDTLQKQVVDLKQDVAKIITEKYNYQLTLNNTRSTVNILMERLKKSDADVEEFKAELESVQLAKGALEQSYLSLQEELETLRTKRAESDAALESLQASSQTLQHEVSVKEKMFNEMLTCEEETLAKFNTIASSFQQRIDADVSHHIDLYTKLRRKDETREVYIQDMKKALDEFATALQFAQIELDSKEGTLAKMREECEQLQLENISLKSKFDESNTKKDQNSTDLEKIEDMLIDSELRAECDKITSWLLSSSTEKCVRNESSNEISELLKCATPNNIVSSGTTPVRNSAGKKAVTTNTTPRTPKSTHTLRTTPKKTVLFPGKENVLSPTKQVLKARNM